MTGTSDEEPDRIAGAIAVMEIADKETLAKLMETHWVSARLGCEALPDLASRYINYVSRLLEELAAEGRTKVTVIPRVNRFGEWFVRTSLGQIVVLTGKFTYIIENVVNRAGLEPATR
jgi:hypothetical protein